MTSLLDQYKTMPNDDDYTERKIGFALACQHTLAKIEFFSNTTNFPETMIWDYEAVVELATKEGVL